MGEDERTIEGYDAHRIARRRKELGLSQRALAKEIGVAEGTVQNIESGRPIFAKTLRSCCAALGIEPVSIQNNPVKFVTPMRVEVTRGVQFRPATPAVQNSEAWKESPAVIVVSAVRIQVDPEEPRGFAEVRSLSLDSKDFGVLFPEPMQATHWVRTAGKGESPQPAGWDTTIGAFRIDAGDVLEQEVLFQAKRLSQTHRAFMEELHRASPDGREVTLKLTVQYTASRGLSTAHHMFRLRSSEIRSLVDRSWGRDGFGIPQYIQIWRSDR